MAHRAGKDSGVIQPITGKRKAATKGESIDNRDVLDCIEASGFSVRYNEVAAELEANGKPVTDGVYANMVTAMRLLGEEEDVEVLRRERTVQLALDSAKETKAYNPLKEYFDRAYEKYKERLIHPETSADWSPIRDLRRCITAKKEDTHADDGIDWPYECLKYWLCGAIAKVDNGFQNWMLVLQGKQGTGKSFLARRLGRAAGAQYFHAGHVDPRNKDHIIKRSSTFVWEAEELDGTMNYSDMALLKAFLTQDSAKERMPYARFATNFVNRCSFIGTVNTSDFLKDTTGNRRFLCLEILKMDIDLIEAMDMDLVWGEAAHDLFSEVADSEGRIRVPDFLKDIQNRVNESVRSVSALEVALDARIVARPNANISSEQLRVLVADLGFLPHAFSQAKQYMVSKGFEYRRCVKINGKVTTGYVGCAIG